MFWLTTVHLLLCSLIIGTLRSNQLKRLVKQKFYSYIQFVSAGKNNTEEISAGKNNTEEVNIF